MRVLLIGYGAIARTVRKALEGEPDLRIAAALVRPAQRAAVQAELGDSVAVLTSVGDIESPIDCALECAGHSGVAGHVPALLSRGIDVILDRKSTRLNSSHT